MKGVGPLSFSGIKTYDQCPHKFYRLKVLKDVKDDFSGPEAVWGNEVHKALEEFIRDGKPLGERFKQFQEYAERLRQIEGDHYVEKKLAITDDGVLKNFFSDEADHRCIIDFLVVRNDRRDALVLDHKGLDANTKIPTPSGFRLMRDLCVGDQVFDKDGVTCTVTDKSRTKYIPCYRVTFNDGSTVVCDEEHLWYTTDGTVIGVHDLMGVQGKTQRSRVPKIPVCAPVEYPKAALPIHPYVLGFWLADGKYSSSEISKPDTFMWDHVQSLGYKVNRDARQTRSCPTYTVQGIRKHLKSLGLLGNKTRRVPEVYLHADIEQRTALLRGLMDGDGSANSSRSQCVYCTTQEGLAQDVQQLLCSLGQQPYISPFTAKGFGVTTTAHYVYFRPRGINPFLTPTKANKVEGWGDGWSGFRRAKSVEQVPIRPTQCIAVDSPSNTYLCTERMIVTHNTGKIRPTKQLHYNALHVFAAFPQVDVVKAAFYWLPKDTFTKYTIHREEIDDVWQEFEKPLVGLEESVATGEWPRISTPLCGWCPVTDCPFNTKHERG